MNKKTTSKQQEIESRETFLLETAGRILLEEGYAAISMERLALELDTAKGTIYNHFPNREEVLLAIAVNAINKRQAMFDMASVSKRPSRERFLAVGVACEIYVTHYPHFFLVENLVRHAAIWDRCSTARRDLLRKQEQRCMSLVAGIVRSAIANDDLHLPPSLSPEEMTLAVWALTYGAYLINATSPSLQEIGVTSIHRSVRFGASRLLDGYRWKPIWTDEDHSRIYQEICQEVFADEKSLPVTNELPQNK